MMSCRLRAGAWIEIEVCSTAAAVDRRSRAEPSEKYSSRRWIEGVLVDQGPFYFRSPCSRPPTIELPGWGTVDRSPLHSFHWDFNGARQRPRPSRSENPLYLLHLLG